MKVAEARKTKRTIERLANRASQRTTEKKVKKQSVAEKESTLKKDKEKHDEAERLLRKITSGKAGETVRF